MYIKEIAEYVAESLNTLEIYQVNINKNYCGNILDLIIVNDRSIKVNVEVESLSLVDKAHPVLSYQYIEKSMWEDDTEYQILSNADYNALKDKLREINWENEFLDVDINKNVKRFNETMNEIILEYVPKKQIEKSLYPVYYSKVTRQELNYKNSLHAKYKEKMTEYDRDKFIEQRFKCKTLTNKEEEAKVQKIEKSIKNDVKEYWKGINDDKSYNHPEEMYSGDKKASDEQVIVNILADHFASVYETKELDEPDFYIPNNTDTMSNIAREDHDIKKAINMTKKDKSPGPVGININFVKECVDELIIQLKIIYNKSLETGVYPNSWKISYIRPIPEDGDQCHCNDN